MSCEICGDTLKKNSGRFCSLQCFHTNTYKMFVEEWLNGSIEGTVGKRNPKPSKYIYRYFREEVAYICSSCGINEWLGTPITLEIDHIDGDRLNSSRDNLRWLCPNCHSQTPTFRNKPRLV